MKEIKEYWRSFPILLYMTVCVLPILSRNLNTTYMLIIVALLFVSSIRRTITIDTNQFVMLLIWILYLIIEYLRRRSDSAIGNLYENILFILPMLYCAINRIDRRSKWIVIISYFALQTYVAVVNVNLLVNNSYLSKYMTAGVEYVVRSHRRTNLGSIANVFSSVIVSLLSIQLLQRTEKRSYRFLLVLLIIINTAFIVLARSTLCLVVFLLGVLLILWAKSKSHRRIALAFAAVLVLLAAFLFIGTIRDAIYDSGMAYEYKNRILELIEWITGGSRINSLEHISGRASDYLSSIVSFLRHPIFGVGMVYSVDVSIIGMHSEVLDFLARYGVMGVMIFAPIVKGFYEKTIDVKSDIAKSILCVVIVYSMFNPCINRTSGIAVFWIIPFAISLITKEERENDFNYLE